MACVPSCSEELVWNLVLSPSLCSRVDVASNKILQEGLLWILLHLFHVFIAKIVLISGVLYQF